MRLLELLCIFTLTKVTVSDPKFSRFQSFQYVFSNVKNLYLDQIQPPFINE